jgi:hypothetical protein
MTFLGQILILLGFAIAFLGEVMFLALAYRRSLWWFFGCLFLPIVCWIFFLLNIKTAFKPFCVQVLGVVLLGIGLLMTGDVL